MTNLPIPPIEIRGPHSMKLLTYGYGTVASLSKTNLRQSDVDQVNKWAKHATWYVKSVLGPRCSVIQSEVCVGIDWENRVASVFNVEDRKYPDMPGYMFGTADLFCITNEDDILVADWKTGGTDGAEKQLLSLGIALRLACPREDGSLRNLITLCLKVDDDGVWPTEYSISEDEIEAHIMSMRLAYEDLEKSTAPVPGIHCTQLYCPHLAYCEAVTGLVEDTALGEKTVAIGQPGAPKTRYVMTTKPINNDQAGHVMAMITAARRQIKYYDKAMKDYVIKGGRVVSGQYEWKSTPQGFRWKKIQTR